MIPRNVEIITMIYKSIDFLDFIVDQFSSDICKSENIKIGFRIICNDASYKVLEHIKTKPVKYTIYNDQKPNDYYLNRIYRAWNHGGMTSEFDNIIFVNSDMAFSEGWIDALFQYHNGKNIPCSRLIESGRMEVGAGIPNKGWARAYNFGTHPKNFNSKAWQESAKISRVDKIGSLGLYMPCLFETKRFRESGGYPEGNLYTTGIGKFGDPFLKSGDDYFFHDILEKKYAMNHITCFNSLVYHIQEGEKSE